MKKRYSEISWTVTIAVLSRSLNQVDGSRKTEYDNLTTSMMFKPLRTIIAAFLTLLMSASGLAAQSIDPADIILKPAPEMEKICTFEPTDINAKRFIRHRDVAGKERSGIKSSEFSVTFRNQCNGEQWPAEAVEAFEYTLGIWEEHLQSSVPVRIEATWRELDGDVLGSAGPTRIAKIGAAGESDTWYSIAQASAMTSTDIVGQNNDVEFDIVVNINCAFSDWYFGEDANPPQDQIDFVTVLLHEIGHGIGFIGSMRADEDVAVAQWGFGDSDDALSPIIYDRFVEDGRNTSVLNENVYPNESEVLYEAVTGRFEGLFFDGMDANNVNFDTPVRLYAPFPWQGGSSYSHVDEETFRNTENSLMRPRLDRQFAIHTPGPVTCGMLSDMGWPLGPSCFELIGVESLLATNQLSFNFGISNVGETETQVLTVSNDASAQDPLSGRIVLDNQNYSIPADRTRFTVLPGNSLDIPIRYIPRRVNEHDSELILLHNSLNQPNPFRINLEGEALQEGRFFTLDQNYPNPFPTIETDQTIIPFALTGSADVRLELFSSTGKRVATLVDGPRDEGRYEVDVNASGLASGMYLYRIIVDGKTDTKKLLYIR